MTCKKKKNSRSLDGAPVIEAAANGNALKLKALIDAGHSIDSRDRDGWSALHKAI